MRADGKGHRRNHSDESINLSHSAEESIELTLEELLCRDPRTNQPGIIPITPLLIGQVRIIPLHLFLLFVLFRDRMLQYQELLYKYMLLSTSSYTIIFSLQVMSRDDVFYQPRSEINPFAMRFKDCPKILGKDCWASMMDLPSPSSPSTPPATPVGSDHWARPLHVRLRRCHSMPGSPTPPAGEAVDRAMAAYPSHTRRTFSVMTSIRKLEDETADDVCDARSDGSSSNDSAISFSLRDFTNRSSLRGSSHRKPSLETQQVLNTSWESRYYSRTELLARCLEARYQQDWQPYQRRSLHERLHPDELDSLVPRSYSSSDSFMSLDEYSMLSPTSSISSHSETDCELWHSRAHLEQYEARLLSRQRFQELVRRWESKQAARDNNNASSGSSSGGLSGGEAAAVALEDTARLSAATGCLRDRPELNINPEKQVQELRRRWEAKQTSHGERRTLFPEGHPAHASHAPVLHGVKKRTLMSEQSRPTHTDSHK